MLPKRVWITGGAGFIGSHLERAAAAVAVGAEVMVLRRPDFDLLDGGGVARAWARDRPGLIVHCAAMSRMEECEADPAGARRLNVEATRQLAELAEDVPLLFLSSDLVFDGTRGNYREGDAVNPRSVYAETKAAAEEIVLRNPRHSVVRLALTAGISPRGRAFNEKMRAAWQAGVVTPLFEDEYRCPLPAVVAARAIWELARSGRPGLYHLAGAERMSRLAIGELLAARWPDVVPRIRRTSLREYQGPPRPADTSLNCARLQSLLPWALPRFPDWVREHPEEPL